MVKLAELGFCKGEIYETIITTFNQDQNPNAAPIGITVQNEQQIILRIFNTSQTLKNLINTKSATINLTSNIDIFYKTAIKEANSNGKLPKEWFVQAETADAPKLANADATIETTLVNITPLDPQKTQATCNVKQINAHKTYPQT